MKIGSYFLYDESHLKIYNEQKTESQQKKNQIDNSIA